MLKNLFSKLDMFGRLLLGIFLLIILLLPFHAVISTWAISNFDNADLFKSWKEILLFLLMVPVAAILFWRLSDKRKLYTKINILVLSYIGINFLLFLVGGDITRQEIAGIIFDTRYLVFFLIAQLIARHYKGLELKEFLIKLIFWCGVVVVSFGALQLLILPPDFLRHLGYRQGIILPYYTVDNNEQLVRIISTLRGANQLGAYLVFWLPILALVTKRIWYFGNKYRYLILLVWAMSIITLYGSGSRSGYAGAIIALAIFSFLQSSKITQKRLLIAGFALATIGLLVLALGWNTRFVQVTLIHNDPNQGAGINSDGQRLDSLMNAIHTIGQNPFGLGLGATNVASTYGKNPRIVENYYLAIAVELGVFGLMLYIAILVLIILNLWKLRHDEIAAALLAGFIGILFVNLLLPAWGDETLSMIWWGAAGVIIATPLVKRKKRATI